MSETPHSIGDVSPLQIALRSSKPTLPSILHDLTQLRAVPSASANAVVELFPHISGQSKLTIISGGSREARRLHRVGVVLSGGQAAGGHNVIIGLFEALRQLNPASQLFGFLNGPSGIIKGQYRELVASELHLYLNSGGFDLIGSGRTKIETPEQLAAAKKTIEALQLDGLVIIGGDDSNTNAAMLGEYLRSQGCVCNVVGAPKTIDGDLRSDDIEVSFGFDTACRTYSEAIGNICRDALSAKKYYHFIRLMGRSASHITLECALQTHPNLAIIGEEVAQQSLTLQQVAERIADVIGVRADAGKDYGVILLPEGLIEFIPDCKALIKELNTLLANGSSAIEDVLPQLTPSAANCLQAMPKEIQAQLLLDRDPHGNVQVSKIETERLFIAMVSDMLQQRSQQGKYSGKFNAQPHFLGYEGRACFPTRFDSSYCYALGYTCALLVDAAANGYIAFVKGLARPVEEWEVGGAPLTSMIHLEERKGSRKPVIRKALVSLDGTAFALFASQREGWVLDDNYRYPGPIQFFGPDAITHGCPLTCL